MTDKIIRGRPFQKGNQAAKNRRRRVSYEAIFSDWQINPALPSAMFEFALPPGAHQVSILSRKSK